jgi:hypothetical protein
MTIAEKAFGAPSPRHNNNLRRDNDRSGPLGGRGLIPDIERVSSAASATASNASNEDANDGDDGSGGSLPSDRQHQQAQVGTSRLKQRPLSGKRLARSDPGPALEIAHHDRKTLSAMFPAVPIRAHPPAPKSIADESITRAREPLRPATAKEKSTHQAGAISSAHQSHHHQGSARERRASEGNNNAAVAASTTTVSALSRPPFVLPFGRSSYARPGLPNPHERDEKKIQDQLAEYAKRLGIPTMEAQEQNHFTHFESVFKGSLSRELATFESRLKVLQQQRAEEEAERQAEEQERTHAAMVKQQQLAAANGGNGGPPLHLQRRSTAIMSKSPTLSVKPALGAGATGNSAAAALQRRQSAYVPPLGFGAKGSGDDNQFASPGNLPLRRTSSSPSTSQSNEFPSFEASSAMESTNREHHLTKLMFRRMLLNENALVDWIQKDLGENEVVRRLNAVNDRYGVRRITQDDFYFLMQELMLEPPGMGTTSNAVVFPATSVATVPSDNQAGEGTEDAVRHRHQSRANSMMYLESWSGSDGGHGGGDVDLSEPRGSGTRVAAGGGIGTEGTLPSSAPLRDDLLPPNIGTKHQPQECSWKKRPYTLQRSDADLLFTACDWRLIGVVEDNEVTDAIRLLFRPAEQVIASHCKRVLEGRCSVSQMLSMHEAGTMLRAVSDIARHRYGAQIDSDVHMVMTMLEDVMTSGYVPLVCFRNFTVHGVTLSRALNEMSMNAELPHAQLLIPSPDPDRDMAAVAQLVAQQSHNTNSTTAAVATLSHGKALHSSGSKNNNNSNSGAQHQLQQPNSAPGSPLKTPRQHNASMFRAFDEQNTNHLTTKPSANAAGAPSGVFSSGAFQQDPSSDAFGGGSASSTASPRNTEGRDLTHPRFRADQALVQGRVATHIAEHDAPSWYSSGGIVWMKNAMHGPLAMT